METKADEKKFRSHIQFLGSEMDTAWGFCTKCHAAYNDEDLPDPGLMSAWNLCPKCCDARQCEMAGRLPRWQCEGPASAEHFEGGQFRPFYRCTRPGCVARESRGQQFATCSACNARYCSEQCAVADNQAHARFCRRDK